MADLVEPEWDAQLAQASLNGGDLKAVFETLSPDTTTRSSQPDSKLIEAANSDGKNNYQSEKLSPTNKPLVDEQETAVKQPGRPNNPIKPMLNLVQTERGKHENPESTRAKVIRLEKNFMRRLLDDKGPPPEVISLENELGVRIWNAMSQLVHTFLDLFQRKSDTLNGTVMDGKTKRLRQGLSESPFKSFSNKFARTFYDEPQILQFHFYTVSLIFGVEEIDPKRVSKMLKWTRSGESEDQVAIFKRIKKYLMFKMIEELGLEPYKEVIVTYTLVTKPEDIDTDYFFA